MYQHMNEMYYLQWINNFLTTSMFASYLGVDLRKAHKLIRKGSALHRSKFGYIYTI